MKAFLSLTSLLCVAACATAPIPVETHMGTVTCQNYTKGTVLWDNAITRPAGMTKDEADYYCRQQGLADQFVLNETRKSAAP